MKIMTYAEQWTLSMALNRPQLVETGDVTTSEPVVETPGGTFTVSQLKATVENMARGARILLVVSGAVGLVVGGTIGYAVAKGSS
jgi:hypothetical protein